MKPLEKMLCTVTGLVIIFLITNGLSSRSTPPAVNTAKPNHAAHVHGVPLVEKVKVLETLPHDSSVFVQGLEFYQGFLYETGGLYGKSILRKYNVSTGKTEKKINLAPQYFAEGLTIFEDKVYVLTWREHVVLQYDLDFRPLQQFQIATEGWGITHDDESLIYSDGTDQLFFVSPSTFEVKRKLHVRERNKSGLDVSVPRLNELEFVGDVILANIWMTDDLVMIDPKTGYVLKRIKCHVLGERARKAGGADVLNGIAWDSVSNALFVTGKLWPTIHRIALPSSSV